MKKILLFGILLATSFMSYAQKPDTLKTAIQKKAEAIGHGGNNELKINLLFTVIGMPEISYERLLADNMGLGAAVFFGLDNEDMNRQYKFNFTPYYRLYFGAKKASGFFIEGNANIASIRSNYRDYIYISSSSMPGGNNYLNRETTKAYFGLGAAAGGKFLTRNGFLGEAYFGLNRLLSKSSDYGGDEAIPRIGITLGKRF